MNDRKIDQALVERVQKGEKKAFELLVAKYQHRLIRLLARFIKDEHEVNDIAQDTLIKAYRALPSFRGESAFYTWLYRIGMNTAKNFLANSGKRPFISSDVANEDGDILSLADQLSDNHTPEAEMINREILQTVDEAVAKLPEDLKKTIIFREMEGLSYEEIAQIMDCPIGTVRSRIFRAREAIAQELRPLLDTSEDRRW